MMRTSLSLLAVVVAAVAVTSACGGAPTSTQPAAGPASSSAPSSAPSTAPSSEASAPSSPAASQGGDNGAKPAKGEIVSGLAKFYEQKQNLPSDKAKKFAVCMVDTMYDKAKTATLRALQAGDPTKIDTTDTGLIAKSGLDCQSALT